MDARGLVALAVLAGVVVLLFSRRVRVELIALAVPVVLLATGVLQEPAAAFQGFGNLAVLAIAALFVVGAGLAESGVAALLARFVERTGRGSEARTLLLACLPVAALSAFVSNAATVAVFLPAGMALARRGALPRSRLFLPVAFAAMLGGNVTALGTASNLVLADALERSGQGHLGVFAFAPVGLPLALLGLVFLAVCGRCLLPRRHTEDRLREASIPEDLARSYGLTRNLVRVRVGPAATVAGRSLGACGLGERYRVAVVLVRRPGALGTHWYFPGADFQLRQGDDLFLQGDLEHAVRFAEEQHLGLGLAGEHQVEEILDHGVALAEFTLSPRSTFAGRTPREVDFRGRYGLNVLALWRGHRAISGDLAETPLELGDALLVAGPARRVQALCREPDVVPLTGTAEVRDLSRAPLALLLLAVAVVPAVLGWLPLAASALGAALLMVASGCVSPEAAGRAIEWRVLALLAGMMPLGTALEQHGVAAAAGDALAALGGGMGGTGILALLFAAGVFLATLTSNAAAAVILAPVALQAARLGGPSPEAAVLAVAYGCGANFLFPYTNQTSLLVLGPGGYRPLDFLLLGGSLLLVVAVVVVTGLSL